MTIDEKLFDILTNPPAVAALADRCYPVFAAQRSGELYCIWQLVTGRPLTTQENDPPGDGTRHWFYQFSVFGPTFLATKQAAAALLDFLVGYRDGPNGIQRITYIDFRDLQPTDPTRLFHSLIEVDIFENLA